MKITEIKYTEKIFGPKDTSALWFKKLPWRDAINSQNDRRDFQAFTILTDEGITGLSPIYTSPLPASLLEILIGENPMNAERLWSKMFWAMRGSNMSTVGAIDIALWDIIGKATKQPVYQLLGGFRDRVPAYTCGGGLNLSLEQLLEEQQWYVEHGSKALKMKIGLPNPDEDLARVKAVRDAVGPNIDIMVDVNNGWSVNVAIRMAKRLERYDIGWLEEPVWKFDIDGYARVAAATEIPIATGEGMSDLLYFKKMLENKCCDIIQANPQHCGGLTAWRKIAALAEAYGAYMAPHHVEEHPVNAQAVAAVPNGLISENFVPGNPVPNFEFYKGAPKPKDGWIEVSQKPGFGVELDTERMEWYKQKYPVGPPTYNSITRKPQHPGVYLNSIL